MIYWHECWVQMGWFEFFRNFWSLEISQTAVSRFLPWMMQHKYNTQKKSLSSSAVWNDLLMRHQGKISRLFQSEGYNNSNNHSLQPRWAGKHLITHQSLMRMSYRSRCFDGIWKQLHKCIVLKFSYLEVECASDALTLNLLENCIYAEPRTHFNLLCTLHSAKPSSVIKRL